MTELPRKAFRRTAKLASLPLGYVGRTALGVGKRLRGTPADTVLTEVQQRTAEKLFQTLGELKGGAMKFGQALSIFEAALPEEIAEPYREQLTRLQDDAPPMPTITVREIIASELGPDAKNHLRNLDPLPTAAASIGQVHRATWVDDTGEFPVAVKIQYPGAGEALLSDLRQIGRVARGLSGALPGLDVKAIVDEVLERAEEELDYELEAQAQRIFAAEYANDPEIVVPDVVAVGPKVLVTHWLDSASSLAHIIKEGSQAERDYYGELYVRFLFSSPSRTGMLHADPHPGNYRIIPAPDGGLGKLGVLDYGSVARLGEHQLPRTLGSLIRIASMDDYEALALALRDEGFIKENIRVNPEQLRAYLGPFVEPAASTEFTFSRQWMHEQFVRLQNPRGEDFSTMLRLNLPPQYMLIHRTWVGGVGVLSQLGATIRFREILEESLPGFTE